MTDKKAALRAFIISVLALLMCVSMLVGTTYAWFTDTVTSGTNVIRAGFLRLDLIDDSGASLEGEQLRFQDGEGRLLDSVLWEPGSVWSLQDMRVKNKGNLSLRFEVKVNGIQGDQKLLDVISWSATLGGQVFDLEEGLSAKLEPGAVSDEIKITGKMADMVEDEYQGLTVEGISVTVYGYQTTDEEDSFGSYDGSAAFLQRDDSGRVVINSADELRYFAYTVNCGTSYAGETIVLNSDIDLKGEDWTPIGNASHGFSGCFDGSGHTVSDFKVTGRKNAGLFGYALNGAVIKNLNVSDAVISAEDYAGAVLGRGYVDIINCSASDVKIICTPYKVGNKYDGGAKAGGIVGQLLEGSNKIENCSVDGVTILAYRDMGGIVGMMNGDTSISGCNADNVYFGYLTRDLYDGNTPNGYAGLFAGRCADGVTVDFTQNNGFNWIHVVTSATEMKNAVENGEKYIALENSVVLDEPLELTGSVTVIGNGATVSTLSGDRVFNLMNTTGEVEIVLDGIKIDATGKERGISLYNNSGSVSLKIRNCKINAKYYGINIESNNNSVTVNATDSILEGYCAIQTRSANTDARFENCTLIGVNDFDPDGISTNDFAVIVIDGSAANTKITLVDSVIASLENGTAKEAHVLDDTGSAVITAEVV